MSFGVPELQPGFRWIELAPPGAATSIALVATGPQSLGLEVSELLDWESVPLMFSFTDYDGNRLYVAEPAVRERQ
jgi:hypothetical protein